MKTRKNKKTLNEFDKFIISLRDSVRTSISMDFFKNEKEALNSHITKTQLKNVNISLFKNGKIENINYKTRLSDNPYPIENRPRGNSDLESVKYHRKVIQENGKIEQPIWMLKKGTRFILLDGVHRVVATNLEGKKDIPAYVIIEK
jgi:hypothetical protein